MIKEIVTATFYLAIIAVVIYVPYLIVGIYYIYGLIILLIIGGIGAYLTGGFKKEKEST